MLKLDNVTKVYRVGAFGGKTLTAVGDVSFDVRPGEVVSLIGESGSGKSTIGKMILGLTPVTGARSPWTASPSRRARSTTGTSRASSRTLSAATTRSSRPTGCSR
nr:hypothetical protein GCM10020093_070880 [Planobispora longispora]